MKAVLHVTPEYLFFHHFTKVFSICIIIGNTEVFILKVMKNSKTLKCTAVDNRMSAWFVEN